MTGQFVNGRWTPMAKAGAGAAKYGYKLAAAHLAAAKNSHTLMQRSPGNDLAPIALRGQLVMAHNSTERHYNSTHPLHSAFHAHLDRAHNAFNRVMEGQDGGGRYHRSGDMAALGRHIARAHATAQKILAQG